MMNECMRMLGMMDGMGSMMGGMFPGMMLTWLLVLGGVVLLAALLWQRTQGGQPVAVRVLQERYTQRVPGGELDREEYLERRDILQSERP